MNEEVKKEIWVDDEYCSVNHNGTNLYSAINTIFSGVSALILVYKSKLLQTIIITDKRFLRHVNNSSQPIKKLEIFKLKQY